MCSYSKEEIMKRVEEERKLRIATLEDKVKELARKEEKAHEGEGEELHDYGSETVKKEWMKAGNRKYHSSHRHNHHYSDRSRSRSSRSRSNNRKRRSSRSRSDSRSRSYSDESQSGSQSGSQSRSRSRSHRHYKHHKHHHRD